MFFYVGHVCNTAQWTSSKVYDDILDTLPEQGTELKLADVSNKLKLVRASSRVLAATTTLQEEVDGIISHISNLRNGTPPSDKDFPKFSQVTKMVFKKCEDAFEYKYYELPVGCKKVKAQGMTEQSLFGADGLMHMYKDYEAKFTKKDTSDVTFETLKPLKTYRWVFTPGQREHIREWHDIIAKSSSKPTFLKSVCDAGKSDVNCKAIVVASKASSSASSSAVSKELKPCTKTQVAKEERMSHAKSNLMKFCSKPPVSKKMSSVAIGIAMSFVWLYRLVVAPSLRVSTGVVASLRMLHDAVFLMAQWTICHMGRHPTYIKRMHI